MLRLRLPAHTLSQTRIAAWVLTCNICLHHWKWTTNWTLIYNWVRNIEKHSFKAFCWEQASHRAQGRLPGLWENTRGIIVRAGEKQKSTLSLGVTMCKLNAGLEWTFLTGMLFILAFNLTGSICFWGGDIDDRARIRALEGNHTESWWSPQEACCQLPVLKTHCHHWGHWYPLRAGHEQSSKAKLAGGSEEGQAPLVHLRIFPLRSRIET
jgi:hypothetical protein